MTTLRQVIDNRNCIGCGGCAAAFPQSLFMQLTDEGHWQAQPKDGRNHEPALEAAAETICPMSGATADETQIASSLYPRLKQDDRIGRFRRNIVGHVVTGEFRKAGSSGGLVTWLLDRLLATGQVDAVLHVQPSTPSTDSDLLFDYGVSRTSEEVRRGAKSRYYPIHMAAVLDRVMHEEGRYAIVGTPCFIKAVRLLERSGHIPLGRVKYTIGLVCGHLKSRFFGEYLAWQKAVQPQELTAIDFRRKLLDRRASDYGFAVRQTRSEVEQVYSMSSVHGRDWGEGLFKNPACEYCDDVLAECADVAIGDAWLPGYVEDPQGTNVAVIRSEALDRMIADAERTGDLLMTMTDPNTISRSQDPGLRHRREGLMHRLARREEAGQWAPRKRVRPKLEKSPARRRIYDLRLRIAEVSSQAFAWAKREGRLERFKEEISALLLEYEAANKVSLPRRAVRSLRGLVRRVTGAG
jgi:coenzyme F420-reducing hydrogenase beta subunit